MQDLVNGDLWRACRDGGDARAWSALLAEAQDDRAAIAAEIARRLWDEAEAYANGA